MGRPSPNSAHCVTRRLSQETGRHSTWQTAAVRWGTWQAASLKSQANAAPHCQGNRHQITQPLEQRRVVGGAPPVTEDLQCRDHRPVAARQNVGIVAMTAHARSAGAKMGQTRAASPAEDAGGR
ncbi:hypothetical protein NDU88_006567 [Pleurodeles waltl]|uniref:Uncharacterized protein n=1 Tax=Pleurodeles waltl TaxID=8319 RepID=A0AAV7QMB5_PLEWA|nr:hypothetical protein NDU88_006567 [Pleurodeles waltl]